MPQAAYVYVPLSSEENLELGLQGQLWGWKTATLDRSTNRAVVASLGEGDFLILGHGGPSPRVPVGGWEGASLRRVIVGRVVRPLYAATNQVWPDDVYPERIGLEVLGVYRDVSGLSAGAMEALRWSANTQGAAVKEPGVEVLLELAAVNPADEALSEADAAEQETDVLRSVFVRREQAWLRRRKFGNAEELICAICRRTLPARVVHAAHIKRREKANYAERMDPANIMGACTLGCDTLFEFGFIYVDEEGYIRVASHAPPVLGEMASGFEGTRCDAFSQNSSVYFAYHRIEVANAA